jgi:hypothetical protein
MQHAARMHLESALSLPGGGAWKNHETAQAVFMEKMLQEAVSASGFRVFCMLLLRLATMTLRVASQPVSSFVLRAIPLMFLK